jgi:hypothetical protein
MGLTQSTYPDANVKKYTDNEIKQNIRNLFNNNKMNNFSEASYSIKDLENIVVSDTSMNQYGNQQNDQLGGNVKFNSFKNRHLQHNIQEYINTLQRGGNPNDIDLQELTKLSELSEFQKIKEFLVNGANQTGGNNDNDNDINDIINSISSHTHKMTLFEAMRGGAIIKSEDSETDDDDLDLDTDDDDNDDDDNDDNDDNDDDDDDDDDSDEDKTNKKKNKKDSDISSTSSESVKNADFSETSYSQKNNSSELRIIPFYSSSESANAYEHPYVKNRFN